MNPAADLMPFGRIEPLERLFGPSSERELGDDQFRQYLFLCSGSATVEMDGSERRLRPGSLVILPAGVRCRAKIAERAKGVWIAVSDSLMSGQLMPILGAPTPEYWTTYHTPLLIDHWTGRTQTKARRRLQQELEMAREHLREDSAVAVFAYVYVVLLADVHRSNVPGAAISSTYISVSKLSVVSGFRGLIERHFRQHLSVDTYASMIGISTVRLTRTCRAITGDSPLELIHERLFREAMREMTYSERSVAEIAYELGFEEPSYFSRRFKRVAGATPGEFRRANKLVKAQAILRKPSLEGDDTEPEMS